MEKKRSGKSGLIIGIVIGIVIVGLLGFVISNASKKQISHEVANTIYDMPTEDLIDYEDRSWGEDYLRVKDSKAFDSVMNEKFKAFISDEENSIYSITILIYKFDTLGYNNETIKNLADDKLEAYIQGVFDAGDSDKIIVLPATLKLTKGLSYYSTVDDYLSVDKIRSYAIEYVNENLTNANFETMCDVYNRVGRLVEEYPEIDVQTIMPAETLLPVLIANTESAIFKNGQNGFYDSNKRDDTIEKNDLHQNISKTYQYYGDFMTYDYSKKNLRNTDGEAWEEQLLRDYDEHSSALFYKDKSIASSYSQFIDALNGTPFRGSSYEISIGEAPKAVLVTEEYELIMIYSHYIVPINISDMPVIYYEDEIEIK